MPARVLVPVFDLDGTLLDSDAALVAPFLALGLPADAVPFGLPLDEACRRVGISVESYLRHYDPKVAQPFPGAAALVSKVRRWAVCSNKHPLSGHAELERLGWHPEVATFAEVAGGPKRLLPVLTLMDVAPHDAAFIGDTEHDRACAADVGCRFILAGWNTRALRETARVDDLVAAVPGDVLALLER